MKALPYITIVVLALCVVGQGLNSANQSRLIDRQNKALRESTEAMRQLSDADEFLKQQDGKLKLANEALEVALTKEETAFYSVVDDNNRLIKAATSFEATCMQVAHMLQQQRSQ